MKYLILFIIIVTKKIIYQLPKWVFLHVSSNFMTNTTPNFDKQELNLSNEFWKVELNIERGKSVNKDFFKYDKIIKLFESNEWTSNLTIRTENQNNEVKNCLVSGIDGAIYLHTSNDIENSYSVKLKDSYLVLSLGFTFLAFDLEKQEIIWSIRPDMSEIFEFYDLQDDYLLRGEIAIHRIDNDGQIKWSYGGRDIWVNINGENEVIIETDKILLTDFNNDKYLIDFDGKTIEN